MLTPLLTIAECGINLGDRWLLRGANLALHAGDRLALVGRNGAGKSSLMKLLSGHGEMDEGSLWIAPGTQIAYLPQAPEIHPGKTLRAIVTAGYHADATGRPLPTHQAEAILMRLGLDPDQISDGLSGGEARRVSLARSLCTKPDILLLDEPTNHMDLPTIEWMENLLRKHRGALLVVSHDRAFLRNLGTGIIWLHQGRLRRRDGHFSEFDDWSEGILAEESVLLHKMDRRIAKETKWSREGICARRKRNQGRLRDLAKLRHERAKSGGISQHTIRMETGPAEGGGKMVLEGIDLSASVPALTSKTTTTIGQATRRQLLSHFNLLVRRSDRIGIVGPNGIGKSTLVRILLGLQQPDSGRVRKGFGLLHAYFDQRRETLDRTASPWTVLTGGTGDTVQVAGRTKNVTSYLRDFMFDDHKMTQKVSTLSGGEQNRLLLAKLFAQSHNFLVLDEPTNDLDLETLELLQEVIADYDGTILIVSHDRDFLDRTVTALLAFEGDAKIISHAGGYSDYLQRRMATEARHLARTGKQPEGKAGKNPAKGTNISKGGAKAVNYPTRLTFRDQYALDKLPDEIEQLAAAIIKLEAALADPALFTTDPEKFNKAAMALATAQAKKEEKENQWLEVAERAEALASDEDAQP